MGTTTPTIYSLKPAFQRTLRPIADGWAKRGGTANQLTAMGLAISAAAGVAAAVGRMSPQWMLAVPALLFARMALNALDGMVAREHGQASQAGRIFNEMADVGGDLMAYLPFALALPDQAWLVVTVVTMGLLTEFAAVLDEAERRNEGPLGKSDRAFLFGLIAVVIGLGHQPGHWTTVVLAIAIPGLAVTLRNRLRSRA